MEKQTKSNVNGSPMTEDTSESARRQANMPDFLDHQIFRKDLLSRLPNNYDERRMLRRDRRLKNLITIMALLALGLIIRSFLTDAKWYEWPF